MRQLGLLALLVGLAACGFNSAGLTARDGGQPLPDVPDLPAGMPDLPAGMPDLPAATDQPAQPPPIDMRSFDGAGPDLTHDLPQAQSDLAIDVPTPLPDLGAPDLPIDAAAPLPDLGAPDLAVDLGIDQVFPPDHPLVVPD